MMIIKEARRKLGLTQKQMAYLLGMSQGRVSNLDNGYEGRSETKQLQHHLAALVELHEAGRLDNLKTRLEGQAI